MPKRRPKAHTYDSTGADLGAIDPSSGLDPFADTAPGGFVWFPSSDPSLMQASVPAGTALPSDIFNAGMRVDYPQPGMWTYYTPTVASMLSARIGAAADTAIDTGARIAAAAQKALDYGPILLLGLAALYLMYVSEKGR